MFVINQAIIFAIHKDLNKVCSMAILINYRIQYQQNYYIKIKRNYLKQVNYIMKFKDLI